MFSVLARLEVPKVLIPLRRVLIQPGRVITLLRFSTLLFPKNRLLRPDEEKASGLL
jgi:hypothetical protein